MLAHVRRFIVEHFGEHGLAGGDVGQAHLASLFHRVMVGSQ